MRAVLVPAAKVHHAWPHIAQWVSEALTRGNADQSPEDIRQALDRGGMQLWLVWGYESGRDAGPGKPVGVCVTELIDSPRGRCCTLVIVAGESWPRWRHLLGDIERWAVSDWDCERMALIGRKGWARRLVGDGWREMAVVIEKDIGDGR